MSALNPNRSNHDRQLRPRPERTLARLASGLLLLGLFAPALAAQPEASGSEHEATDPGPIDSTILPLPPHAARYEVHRRGRKLGFLDIELWLDADGIYEYRSETEATAFLARLLGLGAKEVGRFRWEKGRILPERYEQLLERPGSDRHWTADYDWERSVAHVEGSEGEFDTPLQPRSVDPLTQRLRLSLWLEAGMDREEYRFWVLDRDEVEPQTFLRQGEVELELPAGCINAVHFQTEEDDPDRADHAWHAPAFNWMPVRWLQVRDGRDELDVRLASTTLALEDGRCDGGDASNSQER